MGRSSSAVWRTTACVVVPRALALVTSSVVQTQQQHVLRRSSASRPLHVLLEKELAMEEEVFEEPEHPVATTTERLFWEWDPRVNECGCPVPVHYAVSRPRRRRPWQSKREPLLFLHGFGVGEFHFEHNLEAMASLTGRPCYAVDLVGQGKSWPRCGEGKGLRVCADTWILQVDHFIQNVIREPVVIVGNSLGGFLATIEAARHPEAVAGLGLLNPTPFWGLWDAETGSPIWDATLPAPRVPRAIGATWFDTLRSPDTVCKLVQQVYASQDRCDPELVTRICEAASAEYGANVFASILFAPRPRESFDDALAAAADNGVPVGLFYGKEDPWVSPMWGQRAFRRLGADVPYYELSPTGHCPHHESPVATNLALCDWLQTLNRRNTEEPCFGSHICVEEADGRHVCVRRVDGQPRTPVESAAHYFWG